MEKKNNYSEVWSREKGDAIEKEDTGNLNVDELQQFISCKYINSGQ